MSCSHGNTYEWECDICKMKMSFTDDDLKRLKDGLIGNDQPADWILYEFSPQRIKALLARLEASERAVRAQENWANAMLVHRSQKEIEILADVADNAREAWRKASGK